MPHVTREMLAEFVRDLDDRRSTAGRT